MLMARRNLMGGKSWVNPYQTEDNALIAMWDAEWNVGGGVHDANATVWKDLVGRFDVPIPSKSIINANNIHLATRALSVEDDEYVRSIEKMTICAVVMKENDYRMNTTRPFVTFSNNIAWRYGPGMGGRIDTDGYIESERKIRYLDFVARPVIGFNSIVCYFDTQKSLLERKLWFNNIAESYAYIESWVDSSPKSGRVALGVDNTRDGRTFISGARVYTRELTQDELDKFYAIDKARFGLT